MTFNNFKKHSWNSISFSSDCLGFQLSHTSALYHREPNFTRTASPGFREDNSFPSSSEFALMSFLLDQCGRSLHWQFVFHKTLTLSLTDMLEVVTLLIWLYTCKIPLYRNDSKLAVCCFSLILHCRNCVL